MSWIEALAAVAACAACALGDHCNRRWIGWLPDDPPRPGRKQHLRPVPLGGVVLLPVAVPWFLCLHEPWLAGAAALAGGLGFLDDRRKERARDLDWRWKALGLGAAAFAVAMAVADPLAAPGGFLAAAVLAFVLINATNFLDNVDGVAAALAAVSLLWLGQGSGPAAVAGFAALGFLPWNWPRPRLFLGDAGAYLLGTAVAWAAARAAAADPRALGAVAVQLADFVQVIAARLVLGVPPWIGDRRHLTHVATNLGLRRAAVAPAFAGLALLAAAAARGL